MAERTPGAMGHINESQDERKKILQNLSLQDEAYCSTVLKESAPKEECFN